MKKSKLLPVIVAGAIVLSSVDARAGLPMTPPTTGVGSPPAWFQALGYSLAACVSSIIAAAMVKNAQQNQPLTQQEAFTCGWAFWFKPPPPPG